MDWKVYAQYHQVPRNSVFTPYSQDDTQIASGFDGLVAGAKLKVTKSLGLHLWTLASAHRELATTGEQGRWQGRARLDVNIGF